MVILRMLFFASVVLFIIVLAIYAKPERPLICKNTLHTPNTFIPFGTCTTAP